MPLNSLRNSNSTPALALKSALRRGLAALPLLPVALLICLSLAAPAWAQGPYTPKQSDADALARIKSVNDTNGWLTGANWTLVPPNPAITYTDSNGVTWAPTPWPRR